MVCCAEFLCLLLLEQTDFLSSSLKFDRWCCHGTVFSPETHPPISPFGLLPAFSFPILLAALSPICPTVHLQSRSPERTNRREYSARDYRQTVLSMTRTFSWNTWETVARAIQQQLHSSGSAHTEPRKWWYPPAFFSYVLLRLWVANKWWEVWSGQFCGFLRVTIPGFFPVTIPDLFWSQNVVAVLRPFCFRIVVAVGWLSFTISIF